MRRGLRKCSVLCTCIDCNIKERDLKSNESKVKLNEDLDSDKCSDNDDSDEYNEDDEDLDIENDKYFNKDTESDYSDQEDNMLMWNCISILAMNSVVLLEMYWHL